jgi:hypothetical protein
LWLTLGWRLGIEAEMRAVVVVVGEVLTEQPTQIAVQRR